MQMKELKVQGQFHGRLLPIYIGRTKRFFFG